MSTALGGDRRQFARSNRTERSGACSVAVGFVLDGGAFDGVYRIFRERVFEPEAVIYMAKACEGALVALKVSDRDDPFTEVIARKIVQLADSGEQDPDRLRDRVLEALGRND